MQLIDLDYIMLISTNTDLIELLKKVSKRLGAKKIKVLNKISQALSELHCNKTPHLIIQDLIFIDESEFLPDLQDEKLEKQIIPAPVFAIIHPNSNSNLQRLQNSSYIGYESTPINENILEQKIRNLFQINSSNEHLDSLKDFFKKNLSLDDTNSSLKKLLPSLIINPNHEEYLLLYSEILHHKRNYSRAEKVLNFILEKNSENFRAQNSLTKVLLATGKFKINTQIEITDEEKE
jgi:hypothetical protein